jgi:hypothetical protein
MKVLNKTDVPQHIKIITADGKNDSIQLNRGKPVELPPGAQLDPTMIAQYVSILKTDPPLVVPQQPVQVAEQAPVADAAVGNE